MPDEDWWRALWPDPDGLVRKLGIESGMSTLDLACGDGYFTAAIARRIAPAEVIGVDLEPAMLEQANIACRALPNCRWQLGNALQLYRSIRAPLDYVLLANTLHGAPDKPALSQQVAAVVKPGGRFGIVNWRPLPREASVVLGKPRGPVTALRMSLEETRAAVEPAGFTLEVQRELPPYHYAAIFKRTGSCRR
jgi:ubiquinone/menaquinone biosynthesis C-methylase UbiE